MAKYAILVQESTLDLIQVLDEGDRPKIEEDPTYFVFETDGTNDTKNHEIKKEDDLYDEKGIAKTHMKFLL